MNSDTFISLFWQPYEILEEDFISSIKYISLNRKNFNTFSIYYGRILQSVCSEIEALLRELCGIRNNKKCNINTYCEKLKELGIDVTIAKVKLTKFEQLDFIPFKNWKKGNSPEWWKANNKIKHTRKNNMQEANLKNVLHALAGLYLLEIQLILKYSLKKDGKLKCEDSQLFSSDLSCEFFPSHWETKEIADSDLNQYTMIE